MSIYTQKKKKILKFVYALQAQRSLKDILHFYSSIMDIDKVNKSKS